MPSTGKTPTLGLNKWELTDKPKMKDFNKDNENIENFAAEHKQKMTEVEKKSKSNEDRLDALRVGTINRLEWYNSESYTGPGNITSITDAPTKRRGFKWSGMSTGPQTLEIKTLPIEPNSDYVLAFLEDIEGSFTSYEIKLAYTSGGQQYKSIVKQGSTPQSNGYKLKTHKFSIPSGATDTKIQFVVQGATSSTSLKVLNLLLARGNVVPDYNLAPEDVLKRLDLLFEKDTSLQNQVNQKAAKVDVIQKVDVPVDRDCNSFKAGNSFCSFDTGNGDFKNTPEGTLAQGSARVFILRNTGLGDGKNRFQQEFINLYPSDTITRYIRNYVYESNTWGKWHKAYDSANKPTPEEIGAYSAYLDMNDTDLNNIKIPGIYSGYKNMANAPSQGISIMEVIRYSPDWVVQRFKTIPPNGKGITYTRGFYNGNTWSDWVKVYDENNRPTPADIGAWDKTAKRLEGVDLNTITEGGIYSTVRNSVDRNAPISADGRLIVLSWNTGHWASQMFFADGGRVFTRTATNLEGTGWTNWAEIYSKQNKPTPQDIGALPTTGGELSGHLIMRPGQKFIGAHNYGFSCRTKEGSDDYVIYIDADNKVHVGYAGRPVKIDSLDIVNKNNKKIYHEDNKPTAADVGASPTNHTHDDRYLQSIKGEVLDFNDIKSPGTFTVGGNDIPNAPHTGSIYGTLLSMSKKGGEYNQLFINSTGLVYARFYNNQGYWTEWNKLYGSINKPRPSEIGAADSNHNHDNAYLGKTSTAANSNKLKNWELAEGNTNFIGIPFIPHDGVMEVGRMIDFHEPGTNKDFNTRLESINGALKCWQDFSAENLWARKYMRINDWYGGSEDGRFYYKQDGKGLYTENVENLYVKDSPVAKGDYWDVGDNTRVVSLGGGLRLVRQWIGTNASNSGGGVSYTIHFPKAWKWVIPISLVSDNMANANTYTSGYCTIDALSNVHLNGGCYQMVAGKSTRIHLTYLAAE
ncbi:tail fiber protein [Clostridium phage A2]|nr:tail fiber protein [Clostridium phage A2]WAB24179.1 tail fiber protein [Clostridium phage C2]WAB24256.1 tail fiber protein [Clostridium phage H1]WAB24333.1 tail fiber protein [Clostridium phage D1]WAB24410.1 tail fiber protein [Clostridium phage E1]